MPSTYSGNLAIELIGTGEQAGTWGATTNTNLGTALEQAIVSSASVTFISGGNTAIALTQTNAFQAARSYRLTVGGASTNTQYLWVPAISKQYVITNSLSNAVIISNGSNGAATGTTVTVPANRSMVVYNDGTNIVEPFTYFNDLSAANVTVTNTINAATVNLTNALGVASGGTGRATLTANNVVLGNGTTAVNFVAPGTSGNVLTSNGTTWVSQASTGVSTGKAIAMAIIFGF